MLELAAGPSEPHRRRSTFRMCLRHQVIWDPAARATCFIGKSHSCPTVRVESLKDGTRYLDHELKALEAYEGSDRIHAGHDFIRARNDALTSTPGSGVAGSPRPGAAAGTRST